MRLEQAVATTLEALPPPFRWSLGLIHAAAAFIATAALLIALPWVSSVHVPDPRDYGQEVAKAGYWMALGALGVSALAQTGRRLAAVLLGGLLFVLLAGLVAFVVISMRLSAHDEPEASSDPCCYPRDR